jgi:hypothetical protein
MHGRMIYDPSVHRGGEEGENSVFVMGDVRVLVT